MRQVDVDLSKASSRVIGSAIDIVGVLPAGGFSEAESSAEGVSMGVSMEGAFMVSSLPSSVARGPLLGSGNSSSAGSEGGAFRIRPEMVEGPTSVIGSSAHERTAPTVINTASNTMSSRAVTENSSRHHAGI